jgi:hypothetical protein
MNFAEYLSQRCEYCDDNDEQCDRTASYRLIGTGGQIMCSQHAVEAYQEYGIDIRAMND